MNLSTPVELPSGLPPVTHAGNILMMGSCFAENMGSLLADNKFRIDLNPFGILYNPLSISTAIRQIIANQAYQSSDLFLYRGQWHSPMHHGSFSASSPDEALQGINIRLRQASDNIHEVDWLMLTFGTAYVYEDRETKQIVSNCHKLPEKNFTRRRLSVQEIVTDYTSLLCGMKARNPKLKVLFTVSPIRHLRDGMHANQLSKSTLLLAIDQLQSSFPDFVFYFPSYEIMLDELRDYRFYSDDMLHPSPLAVRYMWERFSKTFFSSETQKIMEECEAIRKALSHKPFHSDSEEHKRFLGQIVLKIERLKEKYPYLEWKIER